VTRQPVGQYDVLIAGSGVAGSLLANRLAKAGKKVCLLEAGRYHHEPGFSSDELEALSRTYARGGLQTARDVGRPLAGALGELATHTMREEFRAIDTADAQINLIEGLDRILSAYPEELSTTAAGSLRELGVTVQTNKLVTEIADDYVLVKDTKTGEQTLIPTYTVLWGAGVKASPLSEVLAHRAGAELDGVGRVIVHPDLTIANLPDIFVIGDLAHYDHQTGEPLPGVAQVAMQMGNYVADVLRRRRFDKEIKPFEYKDKGMLAVIGRNKAVADIGNLHFAGFPAWLIWVFVHINFLIEFDNKLKVMTQWGWNYLTRRQGARLITGEAEPVWMQLPIEHEKTVHKVDV